MTPSRQVPWARIFAEGFAIVVSILLAFGIQAWWDARVTRTAQLELIGAIRSDFVATREALAEAMETLEDRLARSQAYFDAMRQQTPISLDSLQYLFVATFSGTRFQPRVWAYDGAVSSGALTEIATPELMAALAQFEEGRRWWMTHSEVAGEVHYGGPTWELRRAIGSQDVLTLPDRAPPAFRMSEQAQREAMGSRLAYAATEVHQRVWSNILSAFRNMDAGAEDAIQALDALQDR